MAGSMVFIITRRTRSGSFSDRVLRDVIPPQRASVVVIEEETFGIGLNASTNDVIQAAKNISDLIDEANPDANSVLLVDIEVRASHEKLKNRWDERGGDTSRLFFLPQNKLFQRLERVLIELGYHWRAYAKTQLGRFQGQTTPLDDWCRQFFDLGVGYLARRLVMQLQVVGFGDFNRPFSPRMHEAFGQKILHCYFNDGDHGGSWISVQDQISHDLPVDSVHAINVVDGRFYLPESDADELVIYEDGLWSGSETVKRLKLIKESGWQKPIRFKFVVVTDFGLMVARQAVRHYGLQALIRFDANDSRLEKFLGAGLPPELELGRGMEPRAYFKALHGFVDSRAFQRSGDWPEGADEARNVAQALGAQLVRQWYATERPDDDADDGAEKFCLGGGGFASTMTFTRSVPKVCLPLFWLAGSVSFNGKTVKWNPLFLDARRVSPELLRT